MRARSIRIYNYKSFGGGKNELDIRQGKTIIIGKNESGKSNIIDAFGEIDFSMHPYFMADTYKKLHIGKPAGSIRIELTAEKTGNYPETKITIAEDGIRISGGVRDAASGDPKIKAQLEPLSRSNDGKVKYIVQNFEALVETNPYYLLEKIRILCGEYAEKAGESDDPPGDIFLAALGLDEALSAHIKMLPYVLYFGGGGDNKFEEMYFYDEIAQLSGDNILLKLLKLCGFDREDLLLLAMGGEEGDALVSKINSCLVWVCRQFSEYINMQFELTIRLSMGGFALTVQTPHRRTGYNDAGLSTKWFFSLFVFMLHKNIQNETIVFVFDSPGSDMHVNGQKELVAFFDRLGARGHQVVYTTHSPFMIDTKNIGNLRAVEKVGGQTNIHNKIYSSDLDGKSKMETLTPVFQALGMNIDYFGQPGKDRLNVIVEGISDYYYFLAMLEYLAVPDEDMPFVIPSVGVTNISNIASILIGWGEKFKAVVDHDFEGRKAAEKMTQRLGLKPGTDIFYVNGAGKYTQGSDCRVEDLLARSDRSKINLRLSKKSKAMFGREFYDRVLEGGIELESFTVNNFKRLFTALGILKKRVKAPGVASRHESGAGETGNDADSTGQ